MPEMSLHTRFVEYGKLCALKGDFTTALLHYREGMRLAVQQHAPEVVFRHYLECTLEALEHTGSHTELLEYGEAAVAHYATNPPTNALSRWDLAAIHQRNGVIYLKTNDKERAIASFEAALGVLEPGDAKLQLAETLLRWLKSRMHITMERLEHELKYQRYFSVRAETVRSDLALPLPDEMLPKGHSPL